MLRKSVYLLIGILSCTPLALSQSASSKDTIKVVQSIDEGLLEPEAVVSLKIEELGSLDSLQLLSKFPNLRFLQIDHFSGRVAPTYISELTQLEALRFTFDAFDSIPDSYKKLVNLNRIDFVGNSNLDLVKTFSVLNDLPALRELRLEQFDQQLISDELSFPTQIKILSLRNNHLDHIPSGILALQSLELLDAGENDLTGLPVELYGLKNLKTLYLDHESAFQFDQTFELLSKGSTLKVVHIEAPTIDLLNENWNASSPHQLLLDPNLLNASPYYVPNSDLWKSETPLGTPSGKIKIPLSK